MTTAPPLPTARALRDYWASTGALTSAERAEVTTADITTAAQDALAADPEAAAALRVLLDDARRRLRTSTADTRKRAQAALAEPRYAAAPEVAAYVTFQREDPVTSHLSVVCTEQRTVPQEWLVTKDRQFLVEVYDRDNSSDEVALELGWTDEHPVDGGGPFEVDGLQEALAGWLAATHSSVQ